jgi:hypothetical protein
MTYAELQAKMSNQEFELWMALAMVKSEECPSCGRRADEMMTTETLKVKCPICKFEYDRVKNIDGAHRSK